MRAKGSMSALVCLAQSRCSANIGSLYDFIIIVIRLDCGKEQWGEKSWESQYLFPDFGKKNCSPVGINATTQTKTDVFVQPEPHMFITVWFKSMY